MHKKQVRLDCVKSDLQDLQQFESTGVLVLEAISGERSEARGVEAEVEGRVLEGVGVGLQGAGFPGVDF